MYGIKFRTEHRQFSLYFESETDAAMWRDTINNALQSGNSTWRQTRRGAHTLRASQGDRLASLLTETSNDPSTASKKEAEPFRHSRLSLTMQKKSSDSKKPEESAEYGPSEETQCPPEPKRDAY